MARPRITHAGVLRAALLAALACAGSGCGYHVGFTAPADVRTVAVPIFDNLTGPRSGGSRRDLELDLTRAVVREVHERTTLLVAGEDEADLVIRGALVGVGESVLVEDPDDQALLSEARFEVDVQVLRAGEVWRTARLVERVEFRTPSARFGTPEVRILPAAREAFEKLAQRIVMLLEG